MTEEMTEGGTWHPAASSSSARHKPQSHVEEMSEKIITSGISDGAQPDPEPIGAASTPAEAPVQPEPSVEKRKVTVEAPEVTESKLPSVTEAKARSACKRFTIGGTTPIARLPLDTVT